MEDQDISRRLADKLIDIGWRATCDAQHDNLAAAVGELRQMLVPVQMDYLRDQFAMAALPAILDGSWPDLHLSPVSHLSPVENSAKFAYQVAEAMLAAREGEAS